MQRPAPSPAKLVSDELMRRASLPAKAVRAGLTAVRAPLLHYPAGSHGPDFA